MDERGPVTVLLARFEDLVAAGLRSLIGEDPSLRVVVRDWRSPARRGHHRARAARRHPELRLAALPGEIRRLSASHPRRGWSCSPTIRRRANAPSCSRSARRPASARRSQARDVLNTIHLASRGLHVLPHATPATNSAWLLPDLLTPREADVLEELQLGRSNAEIAIALSVSVETVRSHARSVFRKLGVNGRRELATLSAHTR